MSLMQEKPVVAIAVIIVCLLVVGWMAFGRGKSNAGQTTQRWFYDMESGELVAKPAGLEHLPPITLENGHEAVGAHVFACGKCDESEAHQVAYLEKYTEYGKQQALNPVQELSPDPSKQMQQGPMQVIAFPGDEPRWIDINGAMGAQLIAQAKANVCPDGTAAECFPGQQ